MVKYRISSKAVEDLDEIWIHTFENWSIEQADRYYNLLIDEIKFISDSPLNGKAVDYIKIGYRVTRVKSHLIFYKESDNNIIEVIRILHKRMDIENRLND
jgi:toxin ParE1/3/4